MQAEFDIPRTFVAHIRVSLIDIAKIAIFIEKYHYNAGMKSKSKLASLGVRLAADMIKDCEVNGTEDAVGILRHLGYGESVVAGRRDHKPLLKQMSKENLQMDEATERENSQKVAEVLKLMKNQETEQNTGQLKAQQEKAQEHLAEAGSLAPDPEPEPEDSEPKQKNVHTAADEKADIKRQRMGLAGPPPMVVEDEGGES